MSAVMVRPLKRHQFQRLFHNGNCMSATTSLAKQPKRKKQASHHAMRYTLTGQVQGVGFRPFVYHLAIAHNILGWVENHIGHVIIHAEGITKNLQAFQQALIEQAPSPASPCLSEAQATASNHFQQFSIRQSSATTPSTLPSSIHLLTDLPLCESCRKEMNNPLDRRYHYPFINCTQCGPRYTG